MEPIQIEDELKQRLKKNRLAEYQRRMFECQMDLEAAKANNDDKLIEMNENAIQSLMRAYRAVEAI